MAVVTLHGLDGLVLGWSFCKLDTRSLFQCDLAFGNATQTNLDQPHTSSLLEQSWLEQASYKVFFRLGNVLRLEL